MASQGHRPQSVSSDPFTDPYDPFDSPLDPIEMASFPGRSIESQNLQGHGRDSPGVSPPGSPPLGYITRGIGENGQYARVQGSERPMPTVRSGPVSLRSGAASLYSINSMSQYKSVDEHAQRLVDKRAGEIAEWHIHWVTPAMIIGLFVAGLMAAVGHHLFYVHLDGKPSKDQLKMIRYGTAMAFFVKSTLVGCVIMCYRQRIWHTVRTRAMTINGIDGLFSATEDPTQFFLNWEMIRNGKLATFMAACSWLIPIASVLSPASLTSEVVESQVQTNCSAVPNLNFTREAMFDFRHTNEYAGASLAYYNTTDREGKEPGYFDYYDQPSKNLRRLAITTLYMKKSIPNTNASMQSCGQWNCSYSISFEAPGYKCDEIANSKNPADGTAPFNLSLLAPQGDYIYYASVDLDDYKSPQVPTSDLGEPIDKPPYPDFLGRFDSEPILWIGHSVKTNKSYSDDSPYKKWKTVHEPQIIKCTAHYTDYTFEMSYNDTQQNHTVKKRDFHDLLIDTTLTVNPKDPNDTIASPASNYVSPRTDKRKYKKTASFHAMNSLLRDFLRGGINYNNSIIQTKSDISETRLIDQRTSYPLANLKDEIQDVFEDILVTLLGDPTLVVADTNNVPCTKTRSINVFVYHRENLWVGYALAVASTLLFIIVGAWAIHQNGVASDTLFSRILVTTRNPTLDRLSVGACLGGDPFPKELLQTKLRYGVLLEEETREGPLGKVEHCCFGTAGETKEIVKHGVYAGLKEWRDEKAGLEEKEALLGREDADELN